ncbi:MAG: hypothetical protein E7362_01725 [Clostridiales bacterium]|nr:hypothetical protein [Clostridiales bacterium]
MKKIICIIMAIAFAVCFCACSNNGNGQIELVYNEKYIRTDDIDEPVSEQDYIIFYSDGTADYHHFYRYYSTESYTIHLICEQVVEENMMFCFFDGVDYDSIDTGDYKVYNTITYEFMCSKNVVMKTNGNVYVLESFIQNIPNFGS